MFTSYDLVMRDRDYDYSRQINLHRWSEKIEIDEHVVTQMSIYIC